MAKRKQPTDPLEDVISVDEAAAIVGIKAVMMRRHLTAGRVVGKQLGGTWAVWRPSAEVFAKVERPVGRRPVE
jgi:hypothetical protein